MEKMVSVKRTNEDSTKLTCLIFVHLARIPDESEISTSTTTSVEESAVDYSPPTNIWCPWRADSCTQIIRRPGQMTIVMDQEVLLPFELHLSISNDPKNKNYVIHISVDQSIVRMSRTVAGVTTIINQTTEPDYLLHQGKSNSKKLREKIANIFYILNRRSVLAKCRLRESVGQIRSR